MNPVASESENQTVLDTDDKDAAKRMSEEHLEEKNSDVQQPGNGKQSKKKKKKKSSNSVQTQSDDSAVAMNSSEQGKEAVLEKPQVSKAELPSAPEKSERVLRLNEGLKTTRSEGFLAQIGKIFKGQLKNDVTEQLEEILFTADIGVHTSELLLERVTANLKDKGDGKAAMSLLKEEVRQILKSCESPFSIGNEKPHVILTIGVNGAGKTTTLGKLAFQLAASGKKVLLIAGDTFRAAAIEQLDEWAQRCGCEIFRSKQGADPSGTIFDGIKYAKEHGFDVALADTAGRLHNKTELIEELKKINRVSGKAMDGAPHQVLLVLDATNGQNALMQAREFGSAIPFGGIILTKIDGTAKGGVIIGICEEFHKPIYYIGVGEMVYDLQRFNADEFVEELFLQD